MYSSGYSQVSKNSPQAQKRMQYRSKTKSCGYYMRIVFFFSSLIQSLIIVSLVLFLVYGKKQDSASTTRIQDLEESFSRLSIENVALRQQRKNLTNLLNVTLTEKARNDWDLAKLRHYTNISMLVIQDLDRKLQQCFAESVLCRARSPCNCPQLLTTSGNCNCGLMVEQLRARLQFVESNFTQTTQKMRMDMEQIAKERDYNNLEVIRLRRDKSTLERELQFCRQKYKDDFFEYMRGVSNVSRALLEKIDSLFPRHIAFQLTCPKQRDHLEQIRTNCTSLSREVEEKLQRYLNIVGDQVSDIQAENNRLKAENWRLTDDYRWCTQNRSSLILEHKNSLKHLQQKHDQDKERLLVEKMKLLGDKQVLENNVKYKSKEVEHLADQIKYLNMTCMSKIPGFGGYAGGTSGQNGWNLYGGGGSSSSSSIGGGQLGRTASGGLGSSLGSSGSAFNKLGSTGTGSSGSSFLSPGSSSSLGSTGLGYNKPGSTGTGSSSSSFLSPGSSSSLGSTGLGFNKPGSTGTGSSSSSFLSPGSSSSLGSTGLGFNKPGSTGTGSSSSSFLSPGSSSSLGSTGSGINKPGSTGTGSSSSSFLSPGSSSSLGSTGSGFNKPASTGGAFSNFGSAGSSPSLSSSGIGSNKPTLNSRGSSTTGLSSVSTGSSPNLSSSGIGSNKPTTNVKSSSSFGSSSGSTGSTTKTGSSSSGFSWFGLGNSNSGQSKTGTGLGKGTSSGSSGTGSVFGSGRTNGLGGGSVSIAQHLQDLQRIINPPGPEDKQELSRMLG